MIRLFYTILFSIISIYTLFSQNNPSQKINTQDFHSLKDSIDKYIYNDPSKALKFSNQAILKINSINDPCKKAEFYHNIGYVNYNLAKYEDAIKYYEQSLKIKKKLIDVGTISNTINNIGLVYFDWADYKNALDYFQEALEINKKNKDLKKEALSFHNIGLVHFALKEYESALDYYFKALNIRKKIKDDAGIASTLNNLGNVFYGKEELYKALDYYKQSLEIKEKLGNKRGQGNSLNNIGLIHYELGDYQLALDFFNKSLKIKMEIDNKKGIASTYTNMGNVYTALNEDEKAISLFKNSLGISDSLKLIPELIDNYKYLSEVYEKVNDFKVSFNYYKIYHHLLDSLNYENTKVQISDLKLKYINKENQYKIEILEVEKKMDEVKLKKSKNQLKLLIIILLLGVIIIIFILIQYRQKTKTNQILDTTNKKLLDINNKLKESESKLIQLNTSKDKFFSIVSHDLKTPFNALLGFTELLSMKSKNLDIERREKYNTAIYKSSRQLFNLFDNLLKWSQAQTGNIQNNPEKTQLLEIIQENTDLLKIIAEEKSIKFKIMVKENMYFYADRNLVKTIIRNLLTNAVKFSNSEDKILVSAIQNKDYLSIFIQDFGTGISNEDLQRLFKIDERLCVEGTMQEKGTGLGLVICNDFINIVGGKISVESEVGKGSTFSFTLPTKK